MSSLYCDLNDVKNRLSTAGVTLRLDDVPPDSADGDVLDEASAIIDEYCLARYSPENLILSRWTKHLCADIATALLCERRGNDVPATLQARHDKAIEKLERIHSGEYNIADIPQRRAAVPVLSNVRVQLGPVPHVVVIPSRSTGSPTDYAQRVDRYDVLQYVVI